MNRVTLIGRLTRDPEIRYSGTGNNTAIAKYTLAVDRRYRKDGDQETDFISCVAFGKIAEFSEKYLRKGMKIALSGRLQTGSYTNKDGVKIYTTDVIVEEQEFAESRQTGQQSSTAYNPAPAPMPAEQSGGGFMDIPDSDMNGFSY